MKTKTVLIVDDDEDIRKILVKILSAQGMTVWAAEGPEEAKGLLSNCPHVIISDLHMEPVDGFQFIRELRGSQQTKKTPILVLSALNDFSSVKKAIALGVNDYVIKPVSTPLLIRKLKKVLFHQDFLHWDAGPEDQPVETEISIPADIPTLGESGFQLRGPFKLTAGKNIKLECPEFPKLGVDRFPMRASHLMKTYQESGKFLNDVTFIGVDEASSSLVRQFVRERSRQ